MVLEFSLRINELFINFVSMALSRVRRKTESKDFHLLLAALLNIKSVIKSAASTASPGGDST